MPLICQCWIIFLIPIILTPMPMEVNAHCNLQCCFVWVITLTNHIDSWLREREQDPRIEQKKNNNKQLCINCDGGGCRPPLLAWGAIARWEREREGRPVGLESERWERTWLIGAERGENTIIIMHQLRLRRLPHLAADDTPREERAERKRESATLIGAEREEKTNNYASIGLRWQPRQQQSRGWWRAERETRERERYND